MRFYYMFLAKFSVNYLTLPFWCTSQKREFHSNDHHSMTELIAYAFGVLRKPIFLVAYQFIGTNIDCEFQGKQCATRSWKSSKTVSVSTRHRRSLPPFASRCPKSNASPTTTTESPHNLIP